MSKLPLLTAAFLHNKKTVLLTKNGFKFVVIHPRLELGTP